MNIKLNKNAISKKIQNVEYSIFGVIFLFLINQNRL